MKKYTYTTLFTSLLVLLFTACKKDFLNVIPKGRQVAEATQDYNLLLNGRDLYLYQSGGWQSMALMGDDVAAEGTVFAQSSIQSQNSFKWSDDIYTQDDVPLDLRNFLVQLYLINKVINEVTDSKGGTELEKKAIKAEAHANRAFINFQLINFYAKPYLASSASQDPGFPLVREADINLGLPERNTVQEVYESIISDLSTAIADLPARSSTLSTRFSRAAAEGFLGKVYLFMNRPADALPLLSAALADNALAANPARLYDYNVEFGPGGKFQPVSGGIPANSPGQNIFDFTESVLARTFSIGPFSGSQLGSDFVVLSPKAQQLFSASDLRLKFYAPLLAYSQPNPSGRLSKINAYSFSKLGLQLPDLLLLSAEAKARTNDLQGAWSDLENLRKHRMPEPDAIVPQHIRSNQTALISFILNERVREFATEGYRWFDMRRLSVDPLFSGEVFTHLLYNDGSSGNTTTYTLKKERLTMRLPFYITKSNPQLTNNP